MRYISFPSAFNAFLLSNIKGREEDYGISYSIDGYRSDIYLFPDMSPNESDVIIVDKKDASFYNCFENKFIYEFYVATPFDANRQRMEIIKSDESSEIKQHALEKLNDMIKVSAIRSLYDFIQRHIVNGEFVEIYEVWTDHENFNFDAPVHEMRINLDDMLCHPDALRLETRHKLTIVK